MKVIAIIFGVVCGAIVGFALGVIVAMGIGYSSQLASPDDPSAGSVAIVVIITAPGGAIFGAIVGGLAIGRYPRLFCATILPLAILVVGYQATYSTLRSIDRPRDFVVELRGTTGAEYVGLVSIDGKLAKKEGTLPAKLEAEGFRLELAFALVRPDEEKTILVDVSADGYDQETGIESQTGLHLQLKSFGYSEFFGGTSRSWSRMSEEEMEALIKNDIMPKALWMP